MDDQDVVHPARIGRHSGPGGLVRRSVSRDPTQAALEHVRHLLKALAAPQGCTKRTDHEPNWDAERGEQDPDHQSLRVGFDSWIEALKKRPSARSQPDHRASSPCHPDGLRTWPTSLTDDIGQRPLALMALDGV